MRAPSVYVELSTGESVPLASLCRDKPVALVFLRHLGCIFCRRHVHQLRRFPDLNIVFVVMASPADTQAFAEKYGAEHPFICDPERRLYNAFGLRRARMSQVFGPRVLVHSFAALRHGMGKPESDPMQLGGSFVIDRGGEVVWSRRQVDASDNASASEIGKALAAADLAGGKVEA